MKTITHFFHRRKLFLGIVGCFMWLTTVIPTQAATVNVTRGPYLQLGTPDSVTVRWRTDTPTESHVRYGLVPGSPDLTQSVLGTRTDHEVQLTGLLPNSQYYYDLGASSTEWFPGDPDDYFVTSPPHGTAVNTRLWVIGDAGTANSDAAAVRDAYINFAGTRHTDVWLMLGDNAYLDGTDAQYQSAMFDMYPTLLQNTVSWSTRGNHDGASTYYDVFTLPSQAEAGGLVSGTEAYYSFDFGNIHFVCLDSYGSDRSLDGAMARWLPLDLMATTRDWVVAYWHHPPYTKGSHDSDVERELIDMRDNFLPILEAGGVDLVLTGHSHSYERSMLIDSHHGVSSTFGSSMIVDGGDGREDGNGAYNKNTFGPASNEGAVYVVAGSSGKIAGGSLDHPAMYISINNLGSMVIDVFGNRLDAKFLRSDGAVADNFTIIKGGTSVPSAPQNLTAVPGDTEISLSWSRSSGADSYNVRRATSSGGPYQLLATGVTDSSFLDGSLENGMSYYYLVSAVNSIGESADSNEATAIPSSYVDDVVISEMTVSGNVVNGSFIDTQNSDNVYEAIRERQSGGKPSNRHSYLVHKWTVDVTGGDVVTFYVEGYHSPNAGEVDDFVFAWSTDDVNYTDMLTITKTSNDNTYQSFELPNSISGTLYIRVMDTDQTRTKKLLHTLYVDDLFVRSDNGDGGSTEPTTPNGLVATAGDSHVSLNWTPSVGADSYNIYRATTSGVTQGTPLVTGVTATTHVDLGLSNGSPYFYVVSAVNSVGESGVSNEVSATPEAPVLPDAPTQLSLSAKGKRKLNLSWSQSSSSGIQQNNIYRALSENGPFNLVAKVAASTSYQDGGLTSGLKYWYRVTAVNGGGESLPSNSSSGVPR